MADKRKYTKKNLDHWAARKNGFLKTANQIAQTNPPAKRESVPMLNFEFAGEAFAANSEFRDSFSPNITLVDRFKNLNEGMLPWESRSGYMSISNAILMCQRAYANVAIFRNAIESAVEFSNSALHVKTSNQTVKDFFNEWFNRVLMYKFKEQYFRERYMSGNTFAYRFMGRMEDDKFGVMKSAFGAKDPNIPIRYVILNPAQVYLTSGITYANNYVKLLSTYEIQRLQNPMSPEDEQVLKSLPKETRELIKSGGGFQNIYIPLDPKRLLYSFYKKQDYFPLAIPMGYPLLNDLEWKLELKKMDMALSKTIEHVILLITTGDKPDEYGGGINPQNLANLQSIFRNQTLGRVLVADYTTKGQWLIPDIGAILGPEKYIQVENDIREGLQSIFVGDDKFANATMKAKIFTERMKEGQKAFLNDFLIPEVKLICEAMNFRDVPEIEFEEINLDDTSQREKVIVRLAELGLISPEEVFTALDTGVLPEKQTNIVNQQEYKKQRDKGLYEPLLNKAKDEAGSPGGKKKKGKSKVGPIGTKAAAEAVKILAINSRVSDGLKKHYNLKELSDAQQVVANDITQSIVLNEIEKNWLKKISEYIKTPKDLDKEIKGKIQEIASEAETDMFTATILYKMKNAISDLEE